MTIIGAIASVVCLVVCLFAWATPVLAGDAAAGRQIFANNCAVCHIGGGNVVNRAKTLKLSDLEQYQMASLEAIQTQVRQGKNVMPAFGGQLSEAQIEDVATYVLEQAQQGW
jgi:cytochrome c6